MRKPTCEDYDDLDILKIKLMAETPLWNPSSPEFSRQEQSMLDYSVSPTTPARGQIFINSITLYAYDAADVMDNEKSFVIILLL